MPWWSIQPPYAYMHFHCNQECSTGRLQFLTFLKSHEVSSMCVQSGSMMAACINGDEFGSEVVCYFNIIGQSLLEKVLSHTLTCGYFRSFLFEFKMQASGRLSRSVHRQCRFMFIICGHVLRITLDLGGSISLVNGEHYCNTDTRNHMKTLTFFKES